MAASDPHVRVVLGGRDLASPNIRQAAKSLRNLERTSATTSARIEDIGHAPREAFLRVARPMGPFLRALDRDEFDRAHAEWLDVVRRYNAIPWWALGRRRDLGDELAAISYRREVALARLRGQS